MKAMLRLLPLVAGLALLAGCKDDARHKHFMMECTRGVGRSIGSLPGLSPETCEDLYRNPGRPSPLNRLCDGREGMIDVRDWGACGWGAKDEAEAIRYAEQAATECGKPVRYCSR